MTAALLQLAERVEAATGPDRELDFLVWAELNGVTEITYPTEGHPMTPGCGGRVEGRDKDGDWRLFGFIDPGKKARNWSPYGAEDRYPPVTASIDAAMTLVPEGWQVVGLGKSDPDCPPEELRRRLWNARLKRPSEDLRAEWSTVDAATPALALCAAALRARAAQKDT